METIYDGIQRPLKGISDASNSIYIPRGIDLPALDRKKKWAFTPGSLKVGDHITGGDVFGTVFENSLLSEHKILLPPRARGTITRIAEKGEYTVDEKILEIEFNGNKSEHSMMHRWPVRVPVLPTRSCPPTSLLLSVSVSWTRCSPLFRVVPSAFLALSVAERLSSLSLYPSSPTPTSLSTSDVSTVNQSQELD
jgi:vacuolar-type H+-ATPase catalytic subunit A/Vma1